MFVYLYIMCQKIMIKIYVQKPLFKNQVPRVYAELYIVIGSFTYKKS